MQALTFFDIKHDIHHFCALNPGFMWFMSRADPDRAGDGLTGRQASLVSTPNPRCLIDTAAPALPIPPPTTRAPRHPWQEAAA